MRRLTTQKRLPHPDKPPSLALSTPSPDVPSLHPAPTPSFLSHFLPFLLLRCLTALLLRSYFNPDEPWQSLEVAYSHAFPPYGHRTWEWLPPTPLRPYLPILPFISLYHTLRVLHIDTPFLISYGPRLLQSLLVATADVHFYRLATRWMGREAAKWAVLCYVCNWFVLYTMVRTYSNSLEACLTLIALAHWPWPPPHPTASSPTHRRIALTLAALAIVSRPPAIIMWTVLGAQYLLSVPTSHARLKAVAEAVVIGGVVMGCGVAVDRWAYGRWVWVQWNFFALNSLQSIGVLYGTHPFHWYLTEATPVLLSFSLPLFLLSLYRPLPLTRTVLPTLALTLLAYSTNPHKEYRFILPLLPLASLPCGLALSTLPPSSRPSYISLLIAGNLSLFLYFALVHQAGPISAVEFLGHRLHSHTPSPPSIHFWMPCHATPLYSYLHMHPPPELRFLDCAPTLPPIPHHSPDVAFSRHCTSSHLFTRDPRALIRHLYNLSEEGVEGGVVSEECVRMREAWAREDERKPLCERRGGGSVERLPGYVVVYSNHAKDLSGILSEGSYREIGRFFHSHFDDEKEVLIFEREHAGGT